MLMIFRLINADSEKVRKRIEGREKHYRFSALNIDIQLDI